MKHASMLFLCLLESTNFDALLYIFFLKNMSLNLGQRFTANKDASLAACCYVSRY